MHPDVKPARSWYLLALAILIASLALAGIFVWRIIDTFPAPVAEARAGTSLTADLDREGLTVFTNRPVSSVDCTVLNNRGTQVPLRRPGGSEEISVGSTTWFVALRSEEPVRPGRFDVTCQSGDAPLVYAVGPHSSVFGFVGLVFAAIGAVFAGIAGAGITAAIVWAKRRKFLREHQPPPFGYPPAPPYQ
ncbi:hypothetical protein [Hoyosella subflava]|uniref:Uncharacterized protein n=1 Tax=Hoyosella subflava (strain DSM 45089 / JCM 17490 / NBRC 109087 / DQS3-9A1) TaxID=443218 RepID=F6EM12_HOYSD|nr:hypothetical protein [Hoyosella subflava]AEF42793.1 hypothetical protein AS9A_4360 [Hoyosella subflava DQS3-9A1]